MKKAFTLLEVLIVLAIVAVLVAVLVLGSQHVFETQKEVRIEQELTMLLLAAESGARAGAEDFSQEALLQKGWLAIPLSSPVADHAYVVHAEGDAVRVTLEREGVVYARGAFYAEKTGSGHPH